jgi:post-segregation antitoxin (ccd killing protein)
MARLNVYLPDDLATAARERGLNVSALAQSAVRATLAQESTDAWLAQLRPVPPHQATHASGLRALDEARDEPATRHG